MNPMGSILLLLRPWMGYGYSCMLGRAPRTRETLPDFLKIWISIKGTQQCGIGLA